ncbi:Ig-like domain-containing protein [Maribellus mangrovi]|uniref:Ig-like domain-containing protein n=1 Tax=Maribellus mangrovi TaxID=3133146 RepID=UPI0030EB88F6
MKFKSKIPFAIVAVLTWVVFISSCANIGMPSGGPKDTIPPVLESTDPELRALNYKENDVRFTFNEYINTDEISETLVISPPLSKRPTIRTKSKTLIIQFNEDLKDSVTYSLDFKNSLVDNNEKNPIENMRFLFSTGPELDTLRIAGQVVDAFNMEPIEKGLVLLQRNLHDSAVFKVIPDYIARTDEEGMFLMDNIAGGEYRLFALNDMNSDMMYNEGAEEIAFADDLIVPRAEFHENRDTIVEGLDSMLILGHTHFYPDPVYLRYFMEDIFEQYVETAEREARNKCVFIFNESVKDTFNVRLLDYDVKDWNIMEYNPKVDSIVMWIADTTLVKQDSLFMELSYIQLDSVGQPYVYKDTMLMESESLKAEPEKKRKRDEDEEEEEKSPKPVPQFNWVNNISGTMELNSTIRITSPEPIVSFDSTMILLYLAEDTLKTPLKYEFNKNKRAYRTYNISYQWEPQTRYTLSIDSAACFNIYGISSKEFTKSFNTREEDYYGALTFEFSNVPGPMIVQLLKNNDDEAVVRQKTFNEDGTVDFPLLPPEKYKVKVIYDANGNGKWDTGSYQDKYQPERVSYINEVIKLRSNWSETHEWDVAPDPAFQKNIIDKELEEKKRKEALEKARKEKEQERNNSMFKPGSSGGISGGGIGQ